MSLNNQNKQKLTEGSIKISSTQKEDEESRKQEYEVYVIIDQNVCVKPEYDDIVCSVSSGGNPHPVYALTSNSSRSTNVERICYHNYEDILESSNYKKYIVQVGNTNSTDAKILESAGFKVKRRDQLPTNSV